MNRIARALRIVALLLLVTGHAVGAETPAWQPRKFPILLWSNGGNEAYMKLLADAGFTVVMTREEFLPACAKNGLKAIVMPPKGEVITPETAKRLASHPDVLGLFFHDEPTAEVIAQRAEAYQALRQAAPSKLIYVNVAVSPKARNALLQQLRPQLLSYDWYQWWFGSPLDEAKRQKNLYGSLATHQQAARQAGIPLWVWVEASANSGAGKGVKGVLQAENVVCLRQSVYSNLACGAKAIQWFNARLVFTGDQTALSACGRDVATINREIGRLADVLLPLTFSQAIQTGPCAAAPAPDSPVKTGTDNLLIGVFSGTKRGGNSAVLLVVNKDVHKGAQARLEFPRGAKSLRQLDKVTGSWKRLGEGPEATLTLEPGSGELLEVSW